MAQVDISTVSGGGGSTRRAVSTNATTQYWFFKNTSTSTFGYRKTTDSGATWAAFVEVMPRNADLVAVYLPWWHFGSDAKIHCAVYIASTNTVYYRTVGTTSSDALGTEYSFATPASTGAGHTIGVCTSVSDDITISLEYQNNTAGAMYRSVDGGANWTTYGVSFSEAHGGNSDTDELLMFGDPLAADPDDIQAIYVDGTSGEVTLKQLDVSAGTITETLIDRNIIVFATLGNRSAYVLSAAMGQDYILRVFVRRQGPTDVEIQDIDDTVNSDSQADPQVTLSLGGRSCFVAYGAFSGSDATGDNTQQASWTAIHASDFGTQTAVAGRYNTISTPDVLAGYVSVANDVVMIAAAIAAIDATYPVTFDAISTVAAGTGALSWTHAGAAAPAGPSGVLVWVIQNVGATDEVTGVTYGGVAMTRIGFAAKSTGESGAVYLYFLGDSTLVLPGSQTVAVSVNGTGSTKVPRAVTVKALSLGDLAVYEVNGTTITERSKAYKNFTYVRNPAIAIDPDSDDILLAYNRDAGNASYSAVEAYTTISVDNAVTWAAEGAYQTASDALCTVLTVDPGGRPSGQAIFLPVWQVGATASVETTSPPVLGTLSSPTFTAQTPATRATVGTPYSYTFVASGNPTPTYTLSGTVPDGLTLNTTTGVLSGTPTTAGSFTFQITATNSEGSVLSDQINLTVGAAASLRYTTPDYMFVIRNLRTLAIVDEIAPDDVRSVKWTRAWRGGGEWQMTLPRNDRYTPTLLAVQQLVQIIRDGEIEFVGVLRRREIDALAKVWTIGGPDLTGYWLAQRIVGETTADDRSGVGETVIKAYVSAYLGSTAAVARKAASYLSGATFTVAADSAYGASVYGASNRQNLLALTQKLCEGAALTQAITMDAGYTGYTYDVTRIIDHTTATGALPFSVDWDNVEELKFIEDYGQHKNFLYIAGDGIGTTRNVTEVQDAVSVENYMRTEGVVDARFATTANQRTTAGELELLRQDRSRVAVKAKPFRAGRNCVYRTDFDLGWLVTFAEEGLRESSIDLPIVAITVTIGRSGTQPVEDITFDLGVRDGDSVMRKYLNAIYAMQASSQV